MQKHHVLAVIAAMLKTTLAIPAVVWGPGAFDFPALGTPPIVLDNGVTASFQIADANFVIRKGDQPVYNSAAVYPAGCTNNKCRIIFQPDGNLVTYVNDVPTWHTGTYGAGKWLVFYDIEPYLVIYDAQNNPIWVAPVAHPANDVPRVTKGYNPCDDGAASQCGRLSDSGSGNFDDVPEGYSYTINF